jgi:hypothetical protein
MKNLSFLLLFVLAAGAGHAQTNRFYYPDAFYFVKEVNVVSQKGQPFHFDISVKENPADTLSKPRIYAIQARKGKEDFIGNTLVYATAGTGDWKTYSIDGTVDKEATRVWLYVAVNGNGDFYFDNLHYSIADSSGALQQQELPNASFEEKKLLAGYHVSRRFSPDLVIRPSSLARDGKLSVQVTTTGQKPSLNHSFASN